MSDIYIDVTDECSFTPSQGTELYDNTLLKVLYTDPETSKNYTISKNINVYPREEFNKPYKISSRVIDCSNMFIGCNNFSQPINIGPNVTNCANMFYSCQKFNCPVNIGVNVNNFNKMFYYCPNLDSTINIKSTKDDIDVREMFAYCENFNKTVIFPDSNKQFIETFTDCYNLDQPMYLGNNIEDLRRTFYHCNKFNSQVYYNAYRYTSMSGMFGGCDSYNRTFTIHKNITDASYAFSDCSNLDKTISFQSGCIVSDLSGLFQNCAKYDTSIDLRSLPNVHRASDLVRNCINFNKNIYLNWDTVNNISGIVQNCDKFDCFYNSFIDGLKNVTHDVNCQWAFCNCNNIGWGSFNPLIISNYITNCLGMFYNSDIYSSSYITFGNNVTNLVSALQGAKFIGNIYILQNDYCNVQCLLWKKTNAYIVNVHCHNLSIINGTTYINSIVGDPIVWTQESTGVYFNSAYGVRISNQFQEDLIS